MAKPKKSKKIEATSDSGTIPAGKIRCYVTGVLRDDTPEEHVRQRMARSLVEEYGYSKEDMELERTIVLGRAKKRADIVLFEVGQDHTHENIRIIVEVKHDAVKPGDRDQGIDQLQSYLAATPNARYGLWVGREVRAFEKATISGRIRITPTLDIPFADGSTSAARSFDDLVPATDSLKDVFKRCHNYIAANQGGSKEFAFHEFLKVTFCKVYDERNSTKPQFFINPDEQRSARGQKKVLERLQILFKDVLDEYGYIFGKDDEIELKPNVAAYQVAELQKYSLLETDFDYKGQAYEEIVGANSRGDRGEFFTPRNLCAMAVDLVESLLGIEVLLKARVLDPACGTGGFLKTLVHRYASHLYQRALTRWEDETRAKNHARQQLKSICDRNLFGIDFNPVLVRAAQMNLVMHGDGSSNIFHENALLSWGEWSNARARASIEDGTFDLILTNPPFGEDLSVDDSHVLHQYEVSTFCTATPRGSMTPQELFLERCHRFLKKDGLLAVVTPDSIISNPSYNFMRQWILLRYQLIGSVYLPGEMFQPSTGTRTSLLLLRKRTELLTSMDDLCKHADEEVFMANPRKVGHDQRGSPVYRRDADGDIVVKTEKRSSFVRKADGSWHREIAEIEVPQEEDHLPQVAEEFRAWVATQKDWRT